MPRFYTVCVAAMTPAELTLEEQTADGDTALVLAAEAGSVDNVRILLEHGASPHNTNSRNESPLLIGSSKLNQLGEIIIGFLPPVSERSNV